MKLDLFIDNLDENLHPDIKANILKRIKNEICNDISDYDENEASEFKFLTKKILL